MSRSGGGVHGRKVAFSVPRHSGSWNRLARFAPDCFSILSISYSAPHLLKLSKPGVMANAQLELMKQELW